MRLNQRTDYALRILMFMADRGGIGATAGEVADAHELSTGVVRKAMQALSEHGFVETRRGRGRKSRLARDPDEITVGAVVRALEPLDVVECFDPERDTCRLSGACALKGHLDDARRAFLERLDETKLTELSTERTERLAVPD